jgi:hypothetical protein
MSLYFLINNFVFAFGMVGTIVFLMATWLSFDAYRLKPDTFTLLRTIGFSFTALSQCIHALVLENDILSYASVILFVIGLALLVFSFFKKNELMAHAIIVVPAFTLWEQYFSAVSMLLLFGISYLAYRQYKREYNRTWIPFSISFLLVGLSSLVSTVAVGTYSSNLVTLIELIIQAFGFSVLGYWVWQYMRLRIRESVVMLSIGVTFLLATIVTLTFSTILISRVTNETARNLITDVKVLDLSINSLQEEALAKTTLATKDPSIATLIQKNDIAGLNQVAEKILETYNLGFLTITDAVGDVLVRAHALSRRGDSLLGERAFEEALLGNSFVTIEDSPVEGLSIRAGSPINDGKKVIGTIIAGYQLDSVFADNMKRVTGLEMFIYKDMVSVAGTAFASDGITRLVGVSLDDSNIQKSVFEKGDTVTGSVIMGNDPFEASYSPLLNKDGKTIGMLSAAKSEGDIVKIANATNRLTLITVIFILLALLIPIFAVSKKVSENLES